MIKQDTRLLMDYSAV